MGYQFNSCGRTIRVTTEGGFDIYSSEHFEADKDHYQPIELEVYWSGDQSIRAKIIDTIRRQLRQYSCEELEIIESFTGLIVSWRRNMTVKKALQVVAEILDDFRTWILQRHEPIQIG